MIKPQGRDGFDGQYLELLYLLTESLTDLFRVVFGNDGDFVVCDCGGLVVAAKVDVAKLHLGESELWIQLDRADHVVLRLFLVSTPVHQFVHATSLQHAPGEVRHVELPSPDEDVTDVSGLRGIAKRLKVLPVLGRQPDVVGDEPRVQTLGWLRDEKQMQADRTRLNKACCSPSGYPTIEGAPLPTPMHSQTRSAC